jgi:hypothetical protein
MAEELITVPCKILFSVFSRSRNPYQSYDPLEFTSYDRENSTIKFLFEDIPFTLKFSDLYDFGVVQNGDELLKLAKIYDTKNADKTICSLFDIRNYCQTGRFVPPDDGREMIRPDQVGYEDKNTRTLRIMVALISGTGPFLSGTGQMSTDRGTLNLAVTLTNFINIIKVSSATVDREYLERLYPEPYDEYYNQGQRNPENIIFKIVQKLNQTFPDSLAVRGRGGGKKKNGRRSCRTRYKAKHAKHSKSKKRYRKSKKRMLRS